MIGFFIVLCASFFFCFQNVIVRVLFNESSVFGLFNTGGFVEPTLQNSFLLLFMRMVLGVPLMAIPLSRLYGKTWDEIGQLKSPKQRRLLVHALIGGLLMFLYLALLYLSVGLISTGIALTLFFTYPVFTALLSWKILNSPLSRYRWIVMGVILLGSLLTIPRTSGAISQSSWLGVGFGIVSGLTYSLYSVNAQKSFESMHPVPFTWISFTTAMVLSGICLAIGYEPTANLPWTALWISGLLSAIATSVGHLLNNIGIRAIGATSAAMIGATNPALTALLAWMAIQESLNTVQTLGVLIVTLSIAALSREPQSSRHA
ncbi:MAG: DMT family transporter [Elainellaceae cyanobacterium]